MEQSENPVIERLEYWKDKVGNETLQDFYLWKPYLCFMPATRLISEQDKSIPKEIWFDFVDGFFYWFYLHEDPEVKFPFSKIEKLTEKGFEEIIRHMRSPEFQRALINKHQFRPDQISIGGGIQTTLDAESLYKFNQSVKEFLTDGDSIIELRKKFIERFRKDYSLVIPLASAPETEKEEIKDPISIPEKSNSKAKLSENKKSKYELNKISRGIVLHYLMEYGNEKFKPTTAKVALSEYLVQIGEPNGTSGIQGYNKGALALENERTGRKAKPGIITKKDFLNALKCLESEDEKAFAAASEEFNSLCRNDLDSDGGNEPKFFKK